MNTISLDHQFNIVDSGEYEIPYLSSEDEVFMNEEYTALVGLKSSTAILNGGVGITPQQLLGVIRDHLEKLQVVDFDGYRSAALMNIELVLFQINQCDSTSNKELIGEHADD